MSRVQIEFRKPEGTVIQQGNIIVMRYCANRLTRPPRRAPVRRKDWMIEPRHFDRSPSSFVVRVDQSRSRIFVAALHSGTR